VSEAKSKLASIGADARAKRIAAEKAANDATPSWRDRLVRDVGALVSRRPAARRYLIRDPRRAGCPGLVECGKVAMIAAEGGAGKTFLLTDLAFAIATGRRWLQTFDVAGPAKVLFVVGEEDADEMHRRLYDVAQTHDGLVDVDRQNLDRNAVILPLAGVVSPFVELDATGNVAATPFLVDLRQFVADEGPFAAVIVDPLSRFGGSDTEKDNAQATKFIQHLEGFAEPKPTVFVAHHTNKGSRGAGASVDTASARGSSGLTDGARWYAALRVTDLGEEVDERLRRLVTLTFGKTNYGRAGRYDLVLRPGLDSGALVPLDSHDLAMTEEMRAPKARRRLTGAAREEAREDARTRRESEATARHAEHDEAILEIVTQTPGIGQNDLVSALRAKVGSASLTTVRDAGYRLTAAGRIEIRPGARGARLHFVAEAEAGETEF